MADERSITQRLLTALVAQGLITGEQLGHAQEQHVAGGQSLGELLVARGLITPADVRQVLEDELGVPHLELASYSPEPAALRLVAADVARDQKILPLFEIEGMLTVAVANPLDVFSFDELSAQLAYELEPVLCDAADIIDAIEANYQVEAEAAVGAGQVESAASQGGPAVAVAETVLAPATTAEPDAGLIPRAAPEQPAQTAWGRFDLDALAIADAPHAVMLVTDILDAAKEAGASHVHVDPGREDFQLLFKVGSERRTMAGTQVGLLPALVKAVRSLAHIDPEPRKAALGRMRLVLGDAEENVGVSIVPTLFGERVVLTLAPETAAPGDLEAAGMSSDDAADVAGRMKKGKGLVLVAGPVRSGRSSAYDLLLSAAGAAGRTVLSLEESVDVELPGVWQVELAPTTGQSMDASLPAGLGQDVDVLGVDELRDVMQGHMLLQAAADGRMCVATMTASDSADALRRLLEAGVEPQSLAQGVSLVIACRLIVTNCPDCRAQYVSDLATEIELPGGTVCVKGNGCESCGGSGEGPVRGLFEVVKVDESLRRAIARRPSAEKLRDVIGKSGTRSLLENGYSLVASGDVSLEELNAVVPFSKE